MSLFRNILTQICSKSTILSVNLVPTCNYHGLNNLQMNNTILKPIGFNVMPTCGFKVKGILKKRCKDCYFVRRQERLYVICEKHPRHKQMSMVKDEKNTWILTHATQGKIRPCAI